MRPRSIFAGLVALLVIAAAFWQGTASSRADVSTSYHKNTLWTSAYVNASWHGGGYNEDALDLADSDCTAYGGCNTVYFRYQGLGQYAADYTLTNYGGSCAGRTYTVRYYINSTWTPLIRLHFVHLKNMRASSTGTLSYSSEYNEWVGDVWHAETCDGWTGPHAHYSRSTNYGTNAHNGASGFGDAGTWVGSNEVTFVAYGQ